MDVKNEPQEFEQALIGIDVDGEESAHVLLKRPTTCQELARYYWSVSAQEQHYLTEKMRSLMSTNETTPTEENWQDSISVLAMHNRPLSTTWLTQLYGNWQGNFNQPLWQKTAMIETLTYLQHYENELLTAEGATTMLQDALTWLKDAEQQLGRIPKGAEEEWRIILALTSLLIVSFDVGVGKPVFKELKETIIKLQLNSKPIKKAYKQSLKKARTERHALVAKQEAGSLDANELATYKEQKQRLDNEVAIAQLQYYRIAQFVAALKANINCLEIDRTRLQKWQERFEVLSHAVDAFTSSVTGVASLAGGASALLAAIGTVPIFGAGAAALALALPIVFGSLFAGAVATGGALRSSGHMAVGLYYLCRTADEHPINVLFSGKEEEDLLLAITKQYLEGTAGNEQLREGMRGQNSWHVIQFLSGLLLAMEGAKQLKAPLTPAVIASLSTLLRVLYREHRGSKQSINALVCTEVIFLSQELMRTWQWNLLPTLVEKDSTNMTKEDWVEAYRTSGWLYPLGTSIKNKKESKYKKALSDSIAQYEAQKGIQSGKKDKPIFLPWDNWFKGDADVETLQDTYRQYVAKKANEKALNKAYQVVALAMRMDDEAIAKESNPTPRLSMWGRTLARSLMDKISKEGLIMESYEEKKMEAPETAVSASPISQPSPKDRDMAAVIKEINAVESDSQREKIIQLLDAQVKAQKGLQIIVKDAKVTGYQKISADQERLPEGGTYIDVSGSTVGGNQEITTSSRILNVMDEFKKLADIPEDFRQFAREQLVKQFEQQLELDKKEREQALAERAAKYTS